MIKLNRNEEIIISTFKENLLDLDTSILNTKFFTKSWLGISQLNLESFEEKLRELKDLDISKDKESENIDISHIIFYDNTEKNKLFAIEINYFKKLLQEQNQSITKIFNLGDFYIPRSLWWKLCKELYFTQV